MKKILLLSLYSLVLFSAASYANEPLSIEISHPNIRSAEPAKSPACWKGVSSNPFGYDGCLTGTFTYILFKGESGMHFVYTSCSTNGDGVYFFDVSLEQNSIVYGILDAQLRKTGSCYEVARGQGHSWGIVTESFLCKGSICSDDNGN